MTRPAERCDHNPPFLLEVEATAQPNINGLPVGVVLAVWVGIELFPDPWEDRIRIGIVVLLALPASAFAFMNTSSSTRLLWRIERWISGWEDQRGRRASTAAFIRRCSRWIDERKYDSTSGMTWRARRQAAGSALIVAGESLRALFALLLARPTAVLLDQRRPAHPLRWVALGLFLLGSPLDLLAS